MERLQLENALLRASLEVRHAAPLRKEREGFFRRKTKVVLRSQPETQPSGALFQWDADQDTRYANDMHGFESVLHIFSRQWLGIRAAAGSLPGHKLALDASERLKRDQIGSVVRLADQHRISNFIFHGMSPAISQLINHLSASGLSSRLFLVYHGNVVQWCYEPERALAFQALEFARTGKVRRIHFMKRGHELLTPNSFKPILLNMPPRIHLDHVKEVSNFALVPGSSDWRKNLHCNVLGAAMTPELDKVIHFARGIELPAPYEAKLEQIPHLDRPSTFLLMSNCRATLNVSLAECHPMVSLESEAVGTPCLRNPLLLDAYEEHPYVRLVEVADPASPVEISKKLSTILAMDRPELAETIADYLKCISATAHDCYGEFLGL